MSDEVILIFDEIYIQNVKNSMQETLLELTNVVNYLTLSSRIAKISISK